MKKSNDKVKLDKNNEARFYVLVGEKKNWEVSINKKMWGFREPSKGLWNTTQIGDFLAYYVTLPTKKIIGFGKVTKKFTNEELIWKDEKSHNSSIWKYKINFKNFHVCENWEKGIPPIKKMVLRSSRGVVPKETFFDLVKKADAKWSTNIKKQLLD